MMRIMFLSGLLFILLAGCRQVGQGNNEAIVIEKDTLIMTDIHGVSLRLSGVVKDSMLSVFNQISVLETEDTWLLIWKAEMPDSLLSVPIPEGDDISVTEKDYSDYGSHYYSILVGKSKQNKEQYLISIDPDTKVRKIGNYWDMSITINEDKTKVLETWIYR